MSLGHAEAELPRQGSVAYCRSSFQVPSVLAVHKQGKAHLRKGSTRGFHSRSEPGHSRDHLLSVNSGHSMAVSERVRAARLANASLPLNTSALRVEVERHRPSHSLLALPRSKPRPVLHSTIFVCSLRKGIPLNEQSFRKEEQRLH